ncbi:MAG: GEVED domain-containing protein [Bacteroidales bacterium]
MNKSILSILSLALMFCFTSVLGQEKANEQRKELYKDGVYNPYEVLDTRVDNMRYWRKAAELGLTPVQEKVDVPLGTYKSSRINAKSVWREDSPDVPVTEENSTQSENSIFADPTDPDHVLQSNNSTQNPVGSLFGANYFFSYDFGATWDGSLQGAGGSNSGDPATAISLEGRQYVGFIHSNGGQGISYSDDGENWTSVVCGSPPGGWNILDKNHMWIDNSPVSPYAGNVYSAWTGFGNSNDSEIEFVYSDDNGLSYSSHMNISSAVNAGSHNQGVNLQTGPDGQVYAAWAIYDSWPSDESAIGFAKSYDGGASFAPAERIITNIRGIRTSETSKNHRVNSFPVMAVDISGGDMDGTIYIVWANIGVPGINSGSDIDVYIVRSEDEGETWSDPVKVNQDEPGQGAEHYFPWITCDPVTGALSVIFYDDRNVGGTKCEVYCANSFDGGETWEDFRVSDTDFTPAPIAGLAGGYMGDYLGITARDARVYPVWTDTRTGTAMTYVSPYETNSLARPTNLVAAVTFETGEVQLDWQFEPVPTFEYFIVYRDGFEIGTTTENTFTDVLPDYGVYKYKVTAMHDEGESSGPSEVIQWGDAHVTVDPEEIVENIEPNNTSTRFLTIENTGELDLIYEVSSSTEPIRGLDEYCIPAGDCTFGDGITDFEMGDISNLGNGCSPDAYGDYTDMITEVQIGNSYEITLGAGYNDQFVTIWIDFDKDEEFEESEKLLEGFELTNSGELYTTEITIPDGVESGEARMRVKAEWLNVPSDPCEDVSYGETEDYTVNVSGWLYVDRIVDTLDPGNTSIVEINFDSEDLTQGTYYGNIQVESNDPDAPLVDVPVTLNVGGMLPLALQVIAEPTTICMGESSQLEAIVTGGTGNYTYEWTSDPAGFTSTDPDPVVMPEETTTYFVVVDDGENQLNDEITIVVEHTPEQAFTPDGETDMCWGVYQTVYSTQGATGALLYNWVLEPEEAGSINGTGLTATVTWDESYTGLATVMVQGTNNCGLGDMSEALLVTLHELPEVDLGADMTVCANETVTLDAGNPGADYLWSTGETTQTITVDTTGVGIGIVDIWVEVTDVNSCMNTDTITIQFDDCTGIYEVADQWSVQVFPIPTDGKFTIEIKSASNKPVNLSVFNSMGREVYRNEGFVVNNASILELNLNNQREGIYFLNIKGEGINVIKKIVIQK